MNRKWQDDERDENKARRERSSLRRARRRVPVQAEAHVKACALCVSELSLSLRALPKGRVSVHFIAENVPGRQVVGVKLG